jgi:hypothetical protein
LEEFEADQAAGDLEGLVDVGAAFVADARRRYWCSQLIVRSTTQRSLPSPDPRGCFGRLICARMPRARNSRRWRREW